MAGLMTKQLTQPGVEKHLAPWTHTYPHHGPRSGSEDQKCQKLT